MGDEQSDDVPAEELLRSRFRLLAMHLTALGIGEDALAGELHTAVEDFHQKRRSRLRVVPAAG